MGDRSSRRGSDCHCRTSDRAIISFYLNPPTIEAGSMSGDNSASNRVAQVQSLTAKALTNLEYQLFDEVIAKARQYV